MRFVASEIPDVIVVEPDVFRDPRGFFLETYHQQKYAAAGINVAFVQDNHSSSTNGTLRGLHLQLARPQGKLIRVIAGEIYDVAVDVRRGSPTFGRWVAVNLSAENFKQCYIPPGFAHGFCVVSSVADVEYKCTDLYDPASELGIAWNDPTLAIRWPLTHPVLSARDSRHATLAQQIDRLPVWAEMVASVRSTTL